MSFDREADWEWALSKLNPPCDECHMRTFHLYTCSHFERRWTQEELTELRKHRSVPRGDGR